MTQPADIRNTAAVISAVYLACVERWSTYAWLHGVRTPGDTGYTRAWAQRDQTPTAK